MREAGEQYVRIGYECDFLQTVFKVSLFYFFFILHSLSLFLSLYALGFFSAQSARRWMVFVLVMVRWMDFFEVLKTLCLAYVVQKMKAPIKIAISLRDYGKEENGLAVLASYQPTNHPTNRSTNIQQQLHLQISCIRFSHGFQHFSFIGKMFEFSMHNSWHDSVDGSGYFLAYTHIKLIRIRWKNIKKKRVAAATVLVVADSMLKNKKHAVRPYSL